jgi:hypothetical protein
MKDEDATATDAAVANNLAKRMIPPLLIVPKNCAQNPMRP